jgi:hypothetical protein
VKTASPETLVLAPNDLPSKMGPFYSAVSGVPNFEGVTVRTLMVKVAGSLETAVALRALGLGITRSVFDCTVARQRACTRFFDTRPRRPADRTVEGLKSWESMMGEDVIWNGSWFGGVLGRLSVH